MRWRLVIKMVSFGAPARMARQTSAQVDQVMFRIVDDEQARQRPQVVDDLLHRGLRRTAYAERSRQGTQHRRRIVERSYRKPVHTVRELWRLRRRVSDGDSGLSHSRRSEQGQ